MDSYLNSLINSLQFGRVINNLTDVPFHSEHELFQDDNILPDSTRAQEHVNYEIYTNWINQYMYEPIHFTNINRDRQIHELIQMQLMFTEQLDEHIPQNQIDIVIMLPQNIRGSIGSLEAILETMFNHFRGTEPSDVILPLTDDAINKLPIKKFKEITDADKNDVCSICQEKYDSDAEIIILPCKHYFHKECITEWLKNYHHKCPLCRMPCGEHTALVAEEQ